jgi:hypothetical protein
VPAAAESLRAAFPLERQALRSEAPTSMSAALERRLMFMSSLR